MPDLLHLFHHHNHGSNNNNSNNNHNNNNNAQNRSKDHTSTSSHLFSKSPSLRSDTLGLPSQAHTHSQRTQSNNTGTITNPSNNGAISAMPLKHAHSISAMDMSRSLPYTNQQQQQMLNGYNGFDNNTSSSINNSNINMARSLNSQRFPYTETSGQSSYEDDPLFNLQNSTVNQSQQKENDIVLNDKTLISYIQGRGLLPPKKVSNTKNFDNCPLNIYVSTQGDNIFLPTLSSHDDEYLQHLNNVNNNSNNNSNSNSNSNSNTNSTTTLNSANTHRSNNNNSESGEVEDSHRTDEDILADLENSTVAQKFAIIISLEKRTPIKTVNVKLVGDALIYWFNGVPPERRLSKEFYKISEKNWSLDMNKCDAYIKRDGTIKEFSNIPENESSEDNQGKSEEKEVTICKKFSTQEIKNEPYLPLGHTRKQIYIHDLLKNNSNSKFAKFFEPGTYVFFIPVFFVNNQPESIYYPSARVKYTLNCGVIISKTLYAKELAKNSSQTALLGASSSGSDSDSSSNTSPFQSPNNSPINSPPNSLLSTSSSSGRFFKKIISGSAHTSNLSSTSSLLLQQQQQQQQPMPKDLKSFYDSWGVIFGDKPLNFVRIPPLRSISTADKPIYINRVWNNSLAYEVSLPEKYVALDSVIPIRIKLVPIDKTLSVKRIRVGIVEKITLVSKNLEYEFDQIEPLLSDKSNPFYQEFINKRKTDRCLSILEIKANSSTGHPSMKEIVVKNCKKDNLFKFQSKCTDSFIVNCNVKFPKYEPFKTGSSKNKMASHIVKNLSPYGCDRFYALPKEDEDPSDPFYQSQSHRENSNSTFTQQQQSQQRRGGSVGSAIDMDDGLHNSDSTTLKERRGSTAASILSGLLGKKSRRNSAQSSTNGDEAITQSHIGEFIENQSHTQVVHDSLTSQSGVPVKFETTLKHAERGLYTDSVNFSNVHTKHKLEILLRLSKFDEETQKPRHFEVIIDTPICILSELCVKENMSLPTYTTAIMDSIVSDAQNDKIDPPPTFEEAISVPASPMGSPTIQPIHKLLGSDEDIPYGSLNNNDNNYNHSADSLLGSNSLYSSYGKPNFLHAHTAPMTTTTTPSTVNAHMDGFNNIDDLLHSDSMNPPSLPPSTVSIENSGHSTDSGKLSDMLPSYQDTVALLSDDESF